MILNLLSLENAVIQLREILDLCNSDVAHANPLYGKHWRTAAIKTFEYTYDLSVKMIIRHLEITLSTDIKHMLKTYYSRTIHSRTIQIGWSIASAEELPTIHTTRSWRKRSSGTYQVFWTRLNIC